MPENTSSDDIIELTDIIEEDGPRASGSGAGTGDAGVDMSFERELEDLFSDAGPAPAAPSAGTTTPPTPPTSDIDALELEEMDLSSLGLDTPSAAPPQGGKTAAPGDGDEDAIDLSDLIDEDQFPAGMPEANAEPVAGSRDEGSSDLSGLGLGEGDEDLDLIIPGEESPPVPSDAAGPAIAELAAATAGAALCVAKGAGVEPAVAPASASGQGIDLEALDAIIAKAGGPPPKPSEEETQAAAEALAAATARIAALEDRISALEAEVTDVSDLTGRHEVALDAFRAESTAQAARHEAALADLSDGVTDRAVAAVQAMIPDKAGLLDEFTTLLEDRLAAFGVELSRNAPEMPDVAGGLSALSEEIKAFVEARLGAFEADMAARLPAPVDPLLEAEKAETLRRDILAETSRETRAALAKVEEWTGQAGTELSGLRADVDSHVSDLRAERASGVADLRAEIAAVKAVAESARPAEEAAPAPTLDDLAGLRTQIESLSTTLEALRDDVAARVTKVDQDALTTRLRMDMAAEIEKSGVDRDAVYARLRTDLSAEIGKAVPVEAARIIREEIAALAREMED
ncbi:hypothetical protein [Desulfolutivibrio sulfoxidireducens]|uniref:hypothetical protein n=1 Tax=Desulfolutivibrio sulfoxidireducens TaxID=2773299 RepID=UPI00159DA6BE|nr:hypothetical protein [Desulfolutivibrio sulfoxidireducens]QLA21472.1 hypothetical protein GD604_17915 [Desulfolutivibrio sulfoxidireducens]